MRTKITLYVLLILSFIVFPIRLKAQDYYWSNSEKIHLVKDFRSILVRANDKSEREQSLLRLSSVEKIERINSKSLLVSFNTGEENGIEVITSITEQAIYSYLNDSGQEIIPTGEILFMPKKGVAYEKINELVDGQLIIVKEKYGSYRVSVDDYSNLLNFSNRIYESGLVEFCHPNFIMEIVKNQNDPLYPD